MAMKTIYHFWETPPLPEARHGFVYLAAMQGVYKIGATNNTERRLKELRRKWDPQAQFIHVIPSNLYERAEGYLHRKFYSKRIGYERFNLSADDITYIKSLTRLDYEVAE